ncbi:MAG: hypothetical protein R3B54_12140 [Bdellovibrionota bacterium]
MLFGLGLLLPAAQANPYFPYLALDEWSSGGIVVSDLSGDDDVLRTALYLTDGRLLAAGRSDNGSFNDMIVVRFHPDGSLDTSFDSDGIATVAFGGGEAIVHSIATDSLGRAVIVGRAWGFSDYDFGVARLLTDGSLDTSFASIGFRTVDVGGNEFGRAVSIQTNNRILIAGYTTTSSAFNVAMVRLLSDGSLDNSYDTDGMVVTSVNVGDDVVTNMALDTLGRAVVIGTTDNGTNNDFLVMRYHTNGALDTGFGTGGIATKNFGNDDVAWGMQIDTVGKIYLGGRVYSGSSYRMGLQILNPDGSESSSGSYSIASGGLPRSLYIDEQERIVLGGRSYNGANWDYGLIRISQSEGLSQTFDTDGVATVDIVNDDFAYDLAFQTDGKMVLVGRTDTGGFSDFGIVRLLTSGALDTAFSGDGKQNTAFAAGRHDIANAVAIQTNGRIVVAGFTDAGDNEFAVARYLTNGNLDTSFSGDGLNTADFGSGHDIANAVAIQTNGRIVLAGSAYNGTNNDIAVARFHTTGALDTTFSGDGRAITSIGTSEDAGHAMAIQPDGRILVAGYGKIGGNDQFAVVRFLTRGALDTSFSGDGRVNTAFAGSTSDVAYDMALQTDGKIVVGGVSYGTNGKLFALARYLTNGNLDTSFSGDGLVTTSVATEGGALNGITILSNGKIMAVGKTLELTNRIVAVRYTTNGNLDSSFDNDGIFYYSIGSGDDMAFAVKQAPNGSVAIAGATHTGSEYDFAALLFGGFGSLDNSFGTNGRVITPIGSGDDDALAMRYYRGKTVLIGRTVVGANWDIALARYDQNGSTAGGGAADPSFGGTGRVGTDIGNDDMANAAARDSQNRLLIAGYTNDGTDHNFLIARYTEDGVLDTTFRTTGITTVAVSSTHDAANAVAVFSNGAVVAAGYQYNGTAQDFAVVKVTSAGVPDTTFSGDGIATTSINAGDDVAEAVALYTDGRVLAVGSTVSGGNRQFALVRYLSNGNLDNSFSGDGIQTLSLTTNGDTSAFAVVLQSNGRIVVGGRAHDAAGKLVAVARYLSNGTLDNTFNGTGSVVTSLGSNGAELYGLAVDEVGSIFGVGRAFGIRDKLAVVAYLSNGTLDASFSGDGIAILSNGSRDLVGNSVVLGGGGKLVVGGFTHNGTNLDGAVIRVLPSGTLDTTFDGDGIAILTNGANDDLIMGVALSKDGRIYAAGGSNSGSETDVLAARLFP